MPTPEERMFQEAVSAVEKGERVRARDLLTRLLKLDQNNADYWLYMSAVVDTQKERIFCLKETLRLRPDDPTAQQGMAMLGQMPVNPALVIPLRQQRTNWQASYLNEKLPALVSGNIWPRIGLYALVGVFLLAATFGGYWLITRERVTPEPPEARARRLTLAAQQVPATQGVTPTLPATRTPTPLSGGLAATYTPTPFYIKTPRSGSEAFSFGMKAFEAGQWQKMITYMQQVATLEPNAADILYYIGEGYRQLGQASEALKIFNQALAVNPNYAPAYLGRARVRLIKSGQETSARQDLEEAVRLDPNFTEAYLELASLFLRIGDTNRAALQVEKAEALSPDSPAVVYTRARVLLAQNDFDQALQAVDRALSLDVGYLDALLLKGQIFQARGEFAGSIEPLQTYTAYRQDPAVLILLGDALYRVERYQDALAAFDRALQLDPKALNAVIGRGKVHLELEDSTKALDDFNKAYGLQKNNFEVVFGLGRAYLLAGNPGKAYVNFNAAFNLMKSDEEKARLYYYRALSLDGMAKLEGRSYTTATINDWRALLALPREVVPEAWAKKASAEIDRLLGRGSTLTPSRTGTPSPTPSRTPISPTP